MTAVNNVNIEIRILPEGDTFEVNLPLDVCISQIVQEFKENVPSMKQETVYKLMMKGGGDYAQDSELTLMGIGIKDGDTLFLGPELIAG